MSSWHLTDTETWNLILFGQCKGKGKGKGKNKIKESDVTDYKPSHIMALSQLDVTL